MSREILFKAKRKNWKELPKEQWWVEGYYFCMIHDDGRHAHHFIMPLGVDLSLGTPIEKIQVEIDPETLCQYIGLTDKNGKKIWENDIIKYHFGEEVAPIKFGLYQNCFDAQRTEHCGFYVDWEAGRNLRKDLGYWVHMVDTKIIGNVFDNPELLEVMQNE